MVKVNFYRKNMISNTKPVLRIEETKINYDNYVKENFEELEKLVNEHTEALILNGEVLDPDGQYFKTYFLAFLEKIDETKNPVEKIKLEYIFEYLIKKENLERINNNIKDIYKYNFTPDINIDDYLNYSKKNYKKLLINAFYKYQEIKERFSNPKYLYKLSEWANEVRNTNKEDFYKRLFLVEYIENILKKEGKSYYAKASW